MVSRSEKTCLALKIVPEVEFLFPRFPRKQPSPITPSPIIDAINFPTVLKKFPASWRREFR